MNTDKTIKEISQDWWYQLGYAKAVELRDKYFPHRPLLTVEERLEIYKAEHPQPTKDNGIIEGLEQAAIDCLKTKYAHLFINGNIINKDRLPSSPNCEAERFKQGAQWHHDTHYKPLLELCEGLKDVIELITTSPEWIKNYGGGAVDIKANAQIQKANKLLNK